MQQLMRFKYWLYILVGLGVSIAAAAQTTTVSGTVVDQGGQTWAHGTISYVFQSNGSFSGPYQWNGGNLPNQYLTPQIVTLSSGGSFSITIPTSTAIAPALSTWRYVVCPNATAPCAILTVPSVGSTQNISSQITAAAATLASTIQAGPMPLAYTDAEIITTPNQGGIYFNVTAFLPKYFDGTSWQFYGSGGGGVISINGVGGPFTFTGLGVSCTSTTCTFAGAGGGSVLLAPSATQVVVQPSGTDLGVNTLNATNYAYNSIENYGDSITQAAGATTFMAPGLIGQQTCWLGDSDWAAACYSNGSTAYAYKLQAEYGNAGHVYGFGGDMAADMTLRMVLYDHPTTQNNPARTGMIGTNDNQIYGTNTNQQNTTLLAEEFSAAHSSIPEALKAFASSCSTTGTWTADSTIPGAMFTTTNGATMSCTFPSSTAFAYVAYLKCDNTSNGAGILTVNGSSGTITPTLLFAGQAGSSILTSNGSHCSLALARNSGLVGSNTILFTATNTGRSEIYWMAGPYIAPLTAVAPPLYVVAGVPYQAANAGQPGIGQYNTISNNVYTTLSADGNNVLWADVQSIMNFTIDFTGGTQSSGDQVCGINSPNASPWAATWLTPLHPGDGGHCHIYEAIHNQLIAQPKPAQVTQMWAGAYGLITSSGSRIGRDGSSPSGSRSMLTVTNTAAPTSGTGGGNFFGVGTLNPNSFASVSNLSGSHIMTYYTGAAGSGAARIIAEAAGGGGNTPNYYTINDAAPSGSRNWVSSVDSSGNFFLQQCSDTFSSCINAFAVTPGNGNISFNNNVAAQVFSGLGFAATNNGNGISGDTVTNTNAGASAQALYHAITNSNEFFAGSGSSASGTGNYVNAHVGSALTFLYHDVVEFQIGPTNNTTVLPFQLPIGLASQSCLGTDGSAVIIAGTCGGGTITLSGAVTGSGTSTITTIYAGILGSALGGLGINTSASTGCPSVTSGTWSIVSCAGGGTVTSIATTGPIGGGTITTTGTITCTTCVVASSPGLGIAHFAGVTQTVTSSLVALGSDVSGNLPNANLASQTANTVLGALTATTPSGLAVPSCSTASSALTWTTGTGFGCNTISGGSITFPQTVAGTTTSGGIVYFSSTTQISSSGIMTAGNFILGGGAGTAPTATFSIVPIANGGTGAATALTNTVFGNPTGSTAAPVFTNAPSLLSLTVSNNVATPKIAVASSSGGLSIGSSSGVLLVSGTPFVQIKAGGNIDTNSSATTALTDFQVADTFANLSGSLTVTAAWIGSNFSNTWGTSGAVITYNSTTPMTTLQLLPTFNVSTSSTGHYDGIFFQPTETSIGAGVTNFFWEQKNNAGTTVSTMTAGGLLTSTLYATTTNCASSASPAVCGSAASGAFTIAAATTSIVVNTTAVTANSEIEIQPDSSLGTRLSVTCNTSLATLVGPVVTARTPGTSFTVTITGTLITNPACYTYSVIN